MSGARKLLYPFSLLYGGIMQVRNKLYDKQIFQSREYDLPVIGIGNLSTGGTGKTPMTELLIRLLKGEYRVATLSRGYKRSSSGFYLLKGSETATEVGDEPLQFKKKFPEVQVAVDEKRVHGIAQLLGAENPPEVILLDDVFQHRKVRAGFYILLTSYDQLYSDDLVLPAGNLRESRAGAERADLVVVTKCPGSLSAEEQRKIARKLSLNPQQELFFSTISYSGEVQNNIRYFPLQELGNFTLVTGIANPKPLLEYLQKNGLQFEHKAFPDHHNFTSAEVEKLKKLELILTTEKDFMRLKDHIPEAKLFYLSIETQIIDQGAKFEKSIKNFLSRFNN